MIDSRIIDEVKMLTPSDKISLMEITASLLRQEMKKNDYKAEGKITFAMLASDIAESGKKALQLGGTILPRDFAINHDKYIYGKAAR